MTPKNLSLSLKLKEKDTFLASNNHHQ